jgi:cytoskeletal protein CcmA (bactofilin family)
MSIEGQAITVRCKGSLRVNGAIEADLHCAELVVGEEAVVKGSIAADTVRVFGQVNGAILGANVVLHQSAQVEGDIHSQSLTIEQGASFDGRSRKVNDPAEVAPQLEIPDAQARAYG